MPQGDSTTAWQGWGQEAATGMGMEGREGGIQG